MGGKGDKLVGDPLLESSITSKCKDVVVKDSVVIGVVTGGGHIITHGESKGIGKTDTMGSYGALKSGGVVL